MAFTGRLGTSDSQLGNIELGFAGGEEALLPGLLGGAQIFSPLVGPPGVLPGVLGGGQVFAPVVGPPGVIPDVLGPAQLFTPTFVFDQFVFPDLLGPAVIFSPLLTIFTPLTPQTGVGGVIGDSLVARTHIWYQDEFGQSPFTPPQQYVVPDLLGGAQVFALTRIDQEVRPTLLGPAVLFDPSIGLTVGPMDLLGPAQIFAPRIDQEVRPGVLGPAVLFTPTVVGGQAVLPTLLGPAQTFEPLVISGIIVAPSPAYNRHIFDNFNRASIGSDWDDFGSDISIVSNVLEVPADSNGFLEYVPPSLPLPTTWSFDFWVPNDPVDGFHSYEVDANGRTLYIDNVGSGTNWTIYPDGLSGIEFAVTGNTWYRAKAYGEEHNGGAAKVKVWKVGDPEPGWLFEGAYTFTASPSPHFIAIDTNSSTYPGRIDNVEFFVLGAILFTPLVFLNLRLGSVTADAVISDLTRHRHNRFTEHEGVDTALTQVLYAAIDTHYQGELPLEELLRDLDRRLSILEDGSAQFERTFRTLAADAVILKTFEQTMTADAVIVSGPGPMPLIGSGQIFAPTVTRYLWPMLGPAVLRAPSIQNPPPIPAPPWPPKLGGAQIFSPTITV